MPKLNNYLHLVGKRKACHRCTGLTNPNDGNCHQYDSDHVGPWSLWQGNLNAQIVIVGQDWGDTSYFLKWAGRDQPRGNPTNENLQKLLETIGIRIGKPREEQEQILFFTNLILCLKEGGLQAPVQRVWFDNCVNDFFKPLVGLISPTAIIALGQKPAEAILRAYGVHFSGSVNYSYLVQHSPYTLTPSTLLFPLYHCGAGAINRNRSMPQQEADWAKIDEWLRKQSRIITKEQEEKQMECYLLNTDAKSMVDGRSPHDKWFDHGMAFCAEYTKDPSKSKDRNMFDRNFSKLHKGDICLMYANEIGVVGAGKVAEEYNGKSYVKPECLVFGPGSDGYGEEHRIKVNWDKDLRNSPISYEKLIGMKIRPRSAFNHIIASKEKILKLIYG